MFNNQIENVRIFHLQIYEMFNYIFIYSVNDTQLSKYVCILFTMYSHISVYIVINYEQINNYGQLINKLIYS